MMSIAFPSKAARRRAVLPRLGLAALILLAPVAPIGAALAQSPQDPAAAAAPSPTPASIPAPTAAPDSTPGQTPVALQPLAPSTGGSETPAPAARPAGAGRPAASAILPHDLSPWGMFMQADIVVKTVMLGLAFASVVTWTVWLSKSLELLAASRANRQILTRVANARSLHEAADGVRGSRSAVAQLVGAAVAEADLSAGMGADGLKERVASRLDRIEAAASRRMTRGTGLLATIGSTAPFVGLFGTVWGIMNAFIGISKSQTTNLAVVAPGIAEALLATAIGLVAAIPAVVIYNMFARWIGGYRVLLADAAAEVGRHLSRDLDRAERPHLQAAE
jgi:biopolymer transport protein ExbB